MVFYNIYVKDFFYNNGIQIIEGSHILVYISFYQFICLLKNNKFINSLFINN